jgi:hypothetical protein
MLILDVKNPASIFIVFSYAYSIFYVVHLILIFIILLSLFNENKINVNRKSLY